MKKSDFWFDLPLEQIAQTPLAQRDSSRMLKLDKNSGEITHKVFTDLEEELDTGDVLVLNNSRVLPARLLGKRCDTGAEIEFLLLAQRERDVWEVMVRPGKRAKIGTFFSFGEGLLGAEVLEVVEGGNRLVKFTHQGHIYSVLDEIGKMPLPPYITQTLEDKERYQTVYSKDLGSAAAPTAGLHFTPELLDRLKAKGVEIVYVTLHVGLGTFRPVKEEEITNHAMHAESYYLPQETAESIQRAKAKGKRVIAVGTTSCRTLETVGSIHPSVVESSGSTNIFIYPGYQFKVIDGLITNFHLPESTLIMLVSAFAGYENTMKAYDQAVKSGYRFFSFGDAMLIV